MNTKNWNTKSSVSPHYFSFHQSNLSPASLNLLNLVQNFIIVSLHLLMPSTRNSSISLTQTLGLLVGSFMVAHEIVLGSSDASKFIVFITYLAQVTIEYVSNLFGVKSITISYMVP